MSFFKGLKGFKILSFLLLVTGCSEYSFAQTIHTNYVRTRVPQIPVTDTLKMDTIPVQRQAVNIEYSDALGRFWQSVQLQGSPNQNDVITPFAYDNMGRTVQIYLPYADETTGSSTKGTFRTNALTNAVNFYNPSSPGAAKIPTDVAPYARTLYEVSPLGRVNEQGGIGSVFQPGTGHTIKATYNVNSTSDGINYYYNIVEGSSVSIKTFAPGVLTKTIVTDENGHRLAQWKDMQGKVVTRTQLDAPSPYYGTDYIYDDFDQLTDMVTPAGKKQLATNGTLFQQGFVKQAYIFHYDSIGRLVEKKVPGQGWVYTVYNHSDQPVLSQDSNMRVKNQWIFVKYDAEGRMVQTGIYINTTVTSRKALQYLCDNSFPVLWETWQPGTGYTNNAFPQQSAIPGASPLAIYTIYYYDDYSFTEAATKPFQTNIYNTTPTLRTMGLLTGASVYVLGTSNQRLVTVNYYDKQNRLIQQQGDNHLGQNDIVNNQYNFIGALTGSQRITTPIAGNPIAVKDRYVYDQMNRLLDTYESFQGAAEVDISHNVYNEISQKVSEGLHSVNYNSPGVMTYTGSGAMPATITENTAVTTGKSDIAGTSVALSQGFTFTATSGNTYVAGIGYSFAQTQEFRYSIRGELTSINNGTLTNDGITQTDPNALFGESITYSETSPLGAAPQYNGNISGITWRNKIEQTGLTGLTTGGQGYAFNYDNVNRLTQSNYYTQSGSAWTQNSLGALTEKVNGYDEMGNIDTLQRKDKSGNLLNNLTYTYQSQGNQLLSVSDAGTQNITGTYTYDGNGNMISDSRKGITITYNYMDLPDTIKQGTSKLVFTYDAAGNKLYKQLISGGSVTSQRHYIGDVELTASSSVAFDGKVESVAMDEGRVVNLGSGVYQYEYFLQDHLYNNRVTFRPNADGTLNLTQAQNYYPFGGDMGDATMNYTASPLNLHKYNGKELQPELGLNTYDFGARHYDPVLARWMAIDPLAEESEGLSPYNYVENNPMNLIDPDGLQPLNGNWRGVPLGSGGSAGAAGMLGGAGLNFGLGLVQAWHKFSFHVTFQNWSGLKNVQQRVTRMLSPVNDFAGGFVNAYASDVTGADAPMSLHNSVNIYNFGRKAGHVAAMFGSTQEIEGGAGLVTIGVAGSPETLGASLTLSAAGAGAVTHGAFTLKNAAMNLMTGKGEDKGTFNNKQDTESGSERQAFRNGKDRNGVPRSQQPDRVEYTREKGTGKLLKLWHFTNSFGERIIMRRDNVKVYRDGGMQGNHFNAGSAKGDKFKQHHNF
jgi:RHS repeat-associated protein